MTGGRQMGPGADLILTPGSAYQEVLGLRLAWLPGLSAVIPQNLVKINSVSAGAD